MEKWYESLLSRRSPQMTSELVLTAHARRRMRQRGISQNEILQVLRDPETSFPGKSPGTTQYRKKLGNVICVVAVDDEYPWKIVTVYSIEEGY